MQYLSFADLIQCNGALKRTFESGNIRISGFGVLLTNPAVDTFAPKIKATAFELAPHQGNDSRFRKTELQAYGLEWRPVLPGHFYHTVYVLMLHGTKVRITSLRKH